jgi:CheY-like chemotaxis protein
MYKTKQKSDNKPHILIAEDSLTSIAVISRDLRDNYYIIHARDGQEAWEILQTDNTIDMVVTDIHMPKMTGHQLLVKIRKSKNTRIANVPVILITTAEDSADRNLAFLNGANDFLNKPIDSMELVARVNVHHKLSTTIRSLSDKANRQFVGAITRSIEFGPGDKQAGIAILSYFSEIVKEKYPDINVKITIEQEDRFVRMIIETPDGSQERIEETLEQYGLVVLGKMIPEKLLSDPISVAGLKNKLELTTVELRHTRDLLRLTESTNVNRITSLEKQVESLHEYIGQSLTGINNAFRLVEKIIESHAVSDTVKDSLELIAKRIEIGIRPRDETEIKRALSTIQTEVPSISDELADFARGSLQGAGGSLLYSWITAIVNSIPK